MSTNRNQHVVPHQDGWAVRGAGAERATQTFDRKTDAVQRGREISQSQGTELVIHGHDPRIGQAQLIDAASQKGSP